MVTISNLLIFFLHNGLLELQITLIRNARKCMHPSKNMGIEIIKIVSLSTSRFCPIKFSKLRVAFDDFHLLENTG